MDKAKLVDRLLAKESTELDCSGKEESGVCGGPGPEGGGCMLEDSAGADGPIKTAGLNRARWAVSSSRLPSRPECRGFGESSGRIGVWARAGSRRVDVASGTRFSGNWPFDIRFLLLSSSLASFRAFMNACLSRRCRSRCASSHAHLSDWSPPISSPELNPKSEIDAAERSD